MIHMFFVSFPLAIVVCDKQMKIMDRFVIKPWQVSRYYPDAAYLVESNDIHTIEKIKIGDEISF